MVNYIALFYSEQPSKGLIQLASITIFLPKCFLFNIHTPRVAQMGMGEWHPCWLRLGEKRSRGNYRLWVFSSVLAWKEDCLLSLPSQVKSTRKLQPSSSSESDRLLRCCHKGEHARLTACDIIHNRPNHCWTDSFHFSCRFWEMGVGY